MPTAAELTGGQFSEQQVISLVEAQAQINIWEGAIRSGKTIGSIVCWLNHLRRMREAEGEPFVFGRTRDSIDRNVFAPIRSVPLLRALAPPSSTSYTSGAPTAKILGQTVHVLGSNDRQAEEKLRGLTGKSAYADEITVLPHPMFRQATGRLSVPGAALFGTTNPDNPNHWLRTEYLDRPHTQGRYVPAEDDAQVLDLAQWHFTLDDNPFVSARYKRDRKAEYTGLWYRRMILGEWVQAEGAIYESFDPARHVVDELPRLDRVLVAGVDYGTVNPLAAVMLAVTADGRLAVTREYRHDSRSARRQLTDAEYSVALRDWLALDEDRPRWITVDPSAASFSEQLHRDGVRGVTDADNSVADGIRLVASLFATGRLIIHRSCAGLIGEIPGYSWDDKAAQKGIDKPIKVADHSVDALRYAVLTTHAAWRRSVPLTQWTYDLAA
jgi:PBSX family phage terminase large subunit